MKEVYMSESGPMALGRVNKIPPVKQPPVELSPEMIASMVDYLVGVPEEFRKAITYVISGDGKLYEVRKTKIGLVSRIPAEVIGVKAKLQEGFQMILPKIPFSLLASTVEFFRGVCDKLGDKSLEAIVQFWWDPSEETYKVVVPEQNVSAGGVDHRGNYDPSGEMIHVADVHSHGRTMSAFWSGTDDRDEARAERLYGVIGNVKDLLPTMAFRARTAGAFVTLAASDLFDLPMETINVPVTIGTILGGKDLKASLDIFKGANVPDEWYEKVKTEVYAPVRREKFYRGSTGYHDPVIRVVDRRHGHESAIEDDWPLRADFTPEKKSFLLWKHGEIIEADARSR